MKDTICRQDAIDALSTPHGILYPIRTIEELPSAQPDITEEDVREWCYKRCLTIIDNALYLEMRSRWLPPAQPEPQWIPCSERLPDEKDVGRALKELGIEKRSDYVIATVEVKGKRMTATACTYDGAWDWADFKVVAWMPLPAPYRESD